MSIVFLPEKPENNYFSPMYYVAKCFREKNTNLQLKTAHPRNHIITVDYKWRRLWIQLPRFIAARGVRWKDCWFPGNRGRQQQRNRWKIPFSFRLNAHTAVWVKISTISSCRNHSLKENEFGRFKYERCIKRSFENARCLVGEVVISKFCRAKRNRNGNSRHFATSVAEKKT